MRDDAACHEFNCSRARPVAPNPNRDQLGASNAPSDIKIRDASMFSGISKP